MLNGLEFDIPDPVTSNLPYIIVVRSSDYSVTIDPYINREMLTWCQANCLHHWAWWFDSNHIYMGFSSQEELTMFQLSCL
jgi:hypothetical protein